MKKMIFALSLCSMLTAGALQLFAGTLTEEECRQYIYDCETACAIDFPGTPWNVCMEWCTPTECHPYL